MTDDVEMAVCEEHGEFPADPAGCPACAAAENGQAPEVLDAVEDRDPAELVVRDPTDAHEVAQVLDRHDEELIVRAIQGRLTKELLYDFPQDGKRVVDLSTDGVDECVREINSRRRDRGFKGITIDRTVPPEIHIEVHDDQQVYVATAAAVDLETGFVKFGTAQQPARLKLKKRTAERYREDGKSVADDDTVWDGFARAKALTKAQRNALGDHIPQTLRQTLIAQYRGDEQALRRIQVGPGAAVAELPAPLTDERAEALRGRCREVYDELRKVNPVRLVPGAFNAMLMRSEWSHERLEELVAHLEGLLEKAKEEA